MSQIKVQELIPDKLYLYKKYCYRCKTYFETDDGYCPRCGSMLRFPPTASTQYELAFDSLIMNEVRFSDETDPSRAIFRCQECGAILRESDYHYLNELVAQDRRILHLYETNDDVFYRRRQATIMDYIRG